MNLTTTLLATKAGGTQGIISMVVIYAAIIAIFWFFAIRPQKKQQKEHDALVSTLAAKMLSISDKELREKLANYKEELKDQVVAKDEKLGKIGYEAYIKQMK